MLLLFALLQMADAKPLTSDEASVRAELTISPTGRVTACTIVQSSGRKDLDKLACDTVTRNARFTPAKDKDGKPTEDRFLTPPIIFRLNN
jgi:TonB family protein